MDTTNIKWDDKGLIPAIIQDSISFNVLMLGYMNKESLDLTLSSKEVTFLVDLDKNYGLRVKLLAIN